VIDLSLNEAETLAAKAARGAGLSWGLADEVGRAARAIAMEGGNWSDALLALAKNVNEFDPPDIERIARWRGGERDVPRPRRLCPVRTAAVLLDDPPNLGAASLEIGHVGLPIWLDAMLKFSDLCVKRSGDPLAAVGDVTIRCRARCPRPAIASRAAIAPQTLAALNAYAARTYVPESERSRLRAGGGSVDDE